MSKQKEEAMTPQDQQEAVDRAVREMVRNTPWILGGIPDDGEPDTSTPISDEELKS